MLLQRCLFSLERRDLLLEPGVLGLLVGEVTLHLLLDAHQLVGEGFLNILGLHRQYGLQCLLLGLKNRDLSLMKGHLILDALDHLLATVSTPAILLSLPPDSSISP